MDISELEAIVREFKQLSSTRGATQKEGEQQSVASIAIALFQLLDNLQFAQSSRSETSPILADQCNKSLNNLRKEVILHGLPIVNEHEKYLPLKNDPFFLKYLNDQLPQYPHRCKTSHLWTYIPPLFTEQELANLPPDHKRYYTPLSPQDNKLIPSQSPSDYLNHPNHQCTFTTNPLPTLRALVWKAFVIGPVLINQLCLGKSKPGIPPPYIAIHRAGSQTVQPSNSLPTLTTPIPASPANLPLYPTSPSQTTTNFDDEIGSTTSEASTTHSASLPTDLSSHHGSSSISMTLNSTSTNTNPLNTIQPTLTKAPITSPELPEPAITITAQEYFNILAQGKGKSYPMIRDDSFRTFRTSEEFTRLVPEQSIIRVCNAFDLQYASHFKYCQGMNVYAGAFLFVLPELDAYNCFALYCTQYNPFYWKANHIGVEAGCIVLDQVLAVVDRELYSKLLSSTPSLSAILYAFSFVKTMSASATPLHEVIKLWDVQLALGPFFNICCVAAQIISLRDTILQSDTPKNLLDYRKWPSLDSKVILAQAMEVLAVLTKPEHFQTFQKLQLHPNDTATVAALAGREPYSKTH